jgi:hypothetical protein
MKPPHSAAFRDLAARCVSLAKVRVWLQAIKAI